MLPQAAAGALQGSLGDNAAKAASGSPGLLGQGIAETPKSLAILGHGIRVQVDLDALPTFRLLGVEECADEALLEVTRALQRVYCIRSSKPRTIPRAMP